ncbi:hypothetical protein BU24DRAFT_182081 [Aaosphaeria arxii CBS 175.79]|uniref:Uncharacterized protein n=1 Tax=Aaosphaeria arxii CBS 175.79 TaxID=1450172 RepID=A0A6A5XQR5_9PLEO|nr:uncharacterized protein BU24DRAFT_182081 [Aaosphaeria arxii CBS 175.79]KAF2015625.1 hypothetical protein BU24DRAFT_182081 [Aaosphaeria arxii CBS 175.79]
MEMAPHSRGFEFDLERSHAMNHLGTGYQPRINVDPLSRMRERVEALLDDQDELAEDRETLLIARQSHYAKALEVRKQRIQTGDAEAGLMTALQDAFPHGIPPGISNAYQRLREERDKLGPLEDDYLQEGEALGGQEWRYVAKEKRFFSIGVMDLLEDDDDDDDDGGHDRRDIQPVPNPLPRKPTSIMPSIAVQYQAAVANLRYLVKQFDTFRQETCHFSDVMSSNATDIEPEPLNQVSVSSMNPKLQKLSSSLLDRIADAQVKVQQLRQELRNHDDGDLNRRLRRNSEPTVIAPRTVSFNASFKAPTEGSSHPVAEFPPVEQRVQEWLLDILRDSALEKAYYLNILEDSMRDVGLVYNSHDSWEDRAVEFWQSDSDNPSPADQRAQHSVLLGSVEPRVAEPVDPRLTIDSRTASRNQDLYEDIDDMSPFRTDEPAPADKEAPMPVVYVPDVPSDSPEPGNMPRIEFYTPVDADSHPQSIPESSEPSGIYLQPSPSRVRIDSGHNSEGSLQWCSPRNDNLGSGKPPDPTVDDDVASLKALEQTDTATAKPSAPSRSNLEGDIPVQYNHPDLESRGQHYLPHTSNKSLLKAHGRSRALSAGPKDSSLPKDLAPPVTHKRHKSTSDLRESSEQQINLLMSSPTYQNPDRYPFVFSNLYSFSPKIPSFRCNG